MGEVVRIATMANLIDMNPAPPMASTGYCLQGGGKWIVYQPKNGRFTVDLSATTDSLSVDWLKLQSRFFVPGLGVRGGGSATVLTPPFSGSAMAFIHPIHTLSVRLTALRGVPESLSLSQNYPNPFNPSTTIDFDVPEGGAVKLLICDVSGRIVRTLVSGRQSAGRFSAIWDGNDDMKEPVASGLYLCRLVVGDRSLIRKMLLIH